jgi:hypothetical protein
MKNYKWKIVCITSYGYDAGCIVEDRMNSTELIDQINKQSRITWTINDPVTVGKSKKVMTFAKAVRYCKPGSCIIYRKNGNEITLCERDQSGKWFI